MSVPSASGDEAEDLHVDSAGSSDEELVPLALGGGVFASAPAFMPRVIQLIEAESRSSPFLQGLHIPDRLRVVDAAASFAAEGAARWALGEGQPG